MDWTHHNPLKSFDGFPAIRHIQAQALRLENLLRSDASYGQIEVQITIISVDTVSVFALPSGPSQPLCGRIVFREEPDSLLHTAL
jgi:hypothetical protein